VSGGSAEQFPELTAVGPGAATLATLTFRQEGAPPGRRYGLLRMRKDLVMAITAGGIIEGWGAPADALQSVMREVAQFRRPRGEDDYVIDIAFRLWDPRREPQFTGVRPGMVGRKQRRFIIWHSVPAGLDDAGSVTAWLTAALPETARLIREHLPRRSKAYPSEELAAEVECLRDELLRSDQPRL
jgi:hypothetical protein